MSKFKMLLASLGLMMFSFANAQELTTTPATLSTKPHAIMIVLTFDINTLEILTVDTYGFPTLDKCKDSYRPASAIVTQVLKDNQNFTLECTSVKVAVTDSI